MLFGIGSESSQLVLISVFKVESTSECMSFIMLKYYFLVLNVFRQILRLDRRVREDVALLGSGFLKLDGNIRSSSKEMLFHDFLN